MNIVEEVQRDMDRLVRKPMSYVTDKARKLGIEAYRLKAAGEENSICFLLSKQLALLTGDFHGLVRDSFFGGFKAEKADRGGYGKDYYDRPKHLRGFARVHF